MTLLKILRKPQEHHPHRSTTIYGDAQRNADASTAAGSFPPSQPNGLLCNIETGLLIILVAAEPSTIECCPIGEASGLLKAVIAGVTEPAAITVGKGSQQGQ